MPEYPVLADGATHSYASSSGRAYEIKNVGGVYSCSCFGWRNQGRHPHYRSCKHLIEYRGARDEAHRIFPGGRAGMPATIDRQLLAHWPSSGRGGTPRPVTVEPASVLDRGALLGGAALRHEPVVKVRFSKPPPPKVSNAWSKLLDDDGPLADPDEAPVARPATADEPEWEAPADEALAAEPTRLAPSRTAPFAVLLAQSWDGVLDPTGWHMSEKLDGVRAYWDGEVFRSRLNNVFATPAWYSEGMPKGVHLDGEFWVGRGRFQETSGFVRRQDRGEYWRRVQYQVFDVPSVAGGFEDRLAVIRRDFILPAHCLKLGHAPCQGITHLRRYLELIEEAGGEGVMLRRPNSRYVRSRSDSLLKVKTFFDTEGDVIRTTPGKGKHVGTIGALTLRIPADITLHVGKKTCFLKGGTEVDVGTGLSDLQRDMAIPAGTRVIFRFQEVSTKGIPRFPSFVGFRNYE